MLPCEYVMCFNIKGVRLTDEIVLYRYIFIAMFVGLVRVSSFIPFVIINTVLCRLAMLIMLMAQAQGNRCFPILCTACGRGQ